MKRLCALLVAGGPVMSGAAQQRVSFARDVVPVLVKNCLACHGEAPRMSNLDLRSRDGMLRGGQRGPAIVPGNASSSRLYRRITHQEKPGMPLNGRMAEGEAAVVGQWIDQGAVWEGAALVPELVTSRDREHWSFQRPVRPPVPRVANPEWSRHPVDAFVARAHEQNNLTPAPVASKATLIRRAYLDLIGLPPPPERVQAFVSDASPGAFEKLIDELLESRHYGERWGRHWLDTVRYADSSGFQYDRDRPTAWRYRDYVIRAFNNDTPYTQFVREQLAGDELDPVTFDGLTATHFLRGGPRVEQREADNPEYRFEYLDDMIATTSQAFLGLTVQCARCHNHKFDPIPQSDYYRLQAVFFPTVDVDHYLAEPEIARPFAAKKEELDAKILQLRQEVVDLEWPYRQKAFLAEVASRFPEDAQEAVRTPEERRTPGQKLLALQLFGAVGVPAQALDRALDSEARAKRKSLQDRIAGLQRQMPQAPPHVAGVTDGDYRFAPPGYGDEPAPGKGVRKEQGVEGTYLHRGGRAYVPPPSYFLDGGDMQRRGPVMEPGFVTVATSGNPAVALPPAHGRSSGRRRALAEWIASPENPLTARVMVNRIWHHHFGRGLAGSLNNFGKLGDRPTHPELLDWLATEFVTRGWSIKAMHRLIMTSNAYRMASTSTSAAGARIDPANRLLWKFPAQRLDAEAIRDSVLAVSGKLNRESGGPAVFPPVDGSVLATMIHGVWKREEDGSKVWRRSVYVYRKRGMPYPLFEVFDLPNSNVSCGGRASSTVPTQALSLMNSDFVSRQARFFAERILEEAGPDAARQIHRTYEVALARPPSEEEAREATEFLGRQRAFHARKTSPVLEALTDLTQVALNLNEFVYLR